MCGILGGNNSKYNYKEALDIISHRGPDNSKIINYTGFTMGFVRLAIRDLTDAGMQPMQSENEEVSLVFNGEIYGYDNLKKELESKYTFHSTCDTEVILNAYLEFGDDFVSHIDGMFAIAIYDRRIQKVKLFRDRVGIKPLYYYYDGCSFAFFSEIKQLEKLGIGKLDIDYSAIFDYLTYQYIPTPKTMYCHCYKVPPAYEIIFDLRTRKIDAKKEYWHLEIGFEKQRKRTLEELQLELKRLIEKSVREQLVSDVPIGVFLSGGVDSSIVAYESNAAHPNIKTFTMGFSEKEYDETKYANELVERYGLNCFSGILGKDDFVKIKTEIRNWYDEPFADTSAYPSFLVSKFAKRDVTVVLSGDGGDELFGGYSRYAYMKNDCKNKRRESSTLYGLFSKLSKYDLISEEWLNNNITPFLDLYKRYIALIDDGKAEEYRKMWNIPKDYDRLWYLRKHYDKNIPFITRLKYLDFKTYLHEDCLTKMDRVSMANSLEVRVPFLSKEIVEFAFSLTDEECVGNFELKKILKDTYIDIIPKDILYHPKKGFSIPTEYLAGTNRNKSRTEVILKNNWGEIV